ncbi:hypothetical protein HYX08_03590 [Candidatus Woesearchaeota archaeon]|nr:hypothetical protein [Candidatus Woesearchaeota archaeon]
MIEQKSCLYCEKVIIRTTENNFNWKTKKYCGDKCKWNYKFFKTSKNERKTKLNRVFPAFEIKGGIKVKTSYTGNENFSLFILKRLIKDVKLVYNPSNIEGSFILNNPNNYSIPNHKEKFLYYKQFIKNGKFREKVIKFLCLLEGQWVPDGYTEIDDNFFLVETKPPYSSGLDEGQRSAIKKCYGKNINLIIFRSYEYLNNIMKVRIMFYTKLNPNYLLNFNFIKQNNIQLILE